MSTKRHDPSHTVGADARYERTRKMLAEAFRKQSAVPAYSSFDGWARIPTWLNQPTKPPVSFAGFDPGRAFRPIERPGVAMALIILGAMAIELLGSERAEQQREATW